MSEPTEKYSITMPRDIAEAARALASDPEDISALCGTSITVIKV
jgi:hypothetical protein